VGRADSEEETAEEESAVAKAVADWAAEDLAAADSAVAADKGVGLAAVAGTADRWAPTPAASQSSCKPRTSRSHTEHSQL